MKWCIVQKTRFGVTSVILNSHLQPWALQSAASKARYELMDQLEAEGYTFELVSVTHF